MVLDLVVTPETMLSLDQGKYRQLCRAGFRHQIADFITRHCGGDPGDGYPAMTDALNAAMPERSFVSCFLLDPTGQRVTLHSFIHPDGRIERLIITLPPG